jgi:ribosomal protein S18 acetylase RimI-like enzyme
MSTSHVVVRSAVIEDLDAICDVHARARATYGQLPNEAYSGPDELERLRSGTRLAITERRHTVLCAISGDHVVGFAVLGARFDGDELVDFHIDPEVWRTGTGVALHRACVTVWQAAELATARLEVFAHNARARAFYASQGWREHTREGDQVTMLLDVESVTSTV